VADDESLIRTLIESWAGPCAPRLCIYIGVLADHADNIVMFDVPPPSDGVRGIYAYAKRGRSSSPGKGMALLSRSSRIASPRAKMSPSHALLRCLTHEELNRDPLD
jgi:hypothetical protein